MMSLGLLARSSVGYHIGLNMIAVTVAEVGSEPPIIGPVSPQPEVCD